MSMCCYVKRIAYDGQCAVVQQGPLAAGFVDYPCCCCCCRSSGNCTASKEAKSRAKPLHLQTAADCWVGTRLSSLSCDQPTVVLVDMLLCLVTSIHVRLLLCQNIAYLPTLLAPCLHRMTGIQAHHVWNKCTASSVLLCTLLLAPAQVLHSLSAPLQAPACL